MIPKESETLSEQLEANEGLVRTIYPGMTADLNRTFAKVLTIKQRRNAPGHTEDFREKVDAMMTKKSG